MITTTTQVALIAMLAIFIMPYLVWRFSKIEAFVPLVVVQIIGGVILGPGVMGALVGASILLLASVGGKLLAAHLAGRLLRWRKGEATVIGWLLQSKGLIEIVSPTSFWTEALSPATPLPPCY